MEIVCFIFLIFLTFLWRFPAAFDRFRHLRGRCALFQPHGKRPVDEPAHRIYATETHGKQARPVNGRAFSHVEKKSKQIISRQQNSDAALRE